MLQSTLLVRDPIPRLLYPHLQTFAPTPTPLPLHAAFWARSVVVLWTIQEIPRVMARTFLRFRCRKCQRRMGGPSLPHSNVPMQPFCYACQGAGGAALFQTLRALHTTEERRRLRAMRNLPPEAPLIPEPEQETEPLLQRRRAMNDRLTEALEAPCPRPFTAAAGYRRHLRHRPTRSPLAAHRDAERNGRMWSRSTLSVERTPAIAPASTQHGSVSSVGRPEWRMAAPAGCISTSVGSIQQSLEQQMQLCLQMSTDLENPMPEPELCLPPRKKIWKRDVLSTYE